MTNFKRAFLFLPWFFIWSSAHGEIRNSQKGIHGNIQLSDQWERVAYLSYIPDMNERFTMANAFIIAQATISTDGNFHFNTRYWPKQDGLYRLHITKKGDPPASLIIGGKEENFLFLIANDTSSIHITAGGDRTLFHNVTIAGYTPNMALKKINDLSRLADSASYLVRGMKREFIENAVDDQLRLIADTSRHPLVALFALYQSNFEMDNAIDKAFAEAFHATWKDEQSHYFSMFRSQFPLQKSHTKNIGWLSILIGAIIGFLLAYLIFRKKPSKDIRSLSVQEKKIYCMLQEGKSNKEISEAFNIGISTVKSHVSNILSKLGAKSRKELMKV
jgi:DNA-binding CsgD family transcriptional regulator